MKRIEYFITYTRETRVDRDLQRSKEEVDSSWWWVLKFDGELWRDLNEPVLRFNFYRYYISSLFSIVEIYV